MKVGTYLCTGRFFQILVRNSIVYFLVQKRQFIIFTLSTLLSPSPQHTFDDVEKIFKSTTTMQFWCYGLHFHIAAQMLYMVCAFVSDLASMFGLCTSFLIMHQEVWLSFVSRLQCNNYILYQIEIDNVILSWYLILHKDTTPQRLQTLVGNCSCHLFSAVE